MGTTAFLSMWISNTATAAMMLPIAHAVLEEIREENEIVAQNPLRQSTSGDQGMSARYVKNYNSTTHEASERVYLELSGLPYLLHFYISNLIIFTPPAGPHQLPTYGASCYHYSVQSQQGLCNN